MCVYFAVFYLVVSPTSPVTSGTFDSVSPCLALSVSASSTAMGFENIVCRGESWH